MEKAYNRIGDNYVSRKLLFVYDLPTMRVKNKFNIDKGTLTKKTISPDEWVPLNPCLFILHSIIISFNIENVPYNYISGMGTPRKYVSLICYIVGPTYCHCMSQL